jgi:hypothetical protein
MRTFFLLLSLVTWLFADRAGNEKCWQRETIDVLQRIDTSTRYTLSGSLNIDPKDDQSDFYFFTPVMAATFDLIVESDDTISLHVGTRCGDHSIYSSSEESPHVILDAPIKESIYIQIQSSHHRPLYYQMHFFIKRLDDNSTPSYEPEHFGSMIECTEHDGNITCKR